MELFLFVAFCIQFLLGCIVFDRSSNDIEDRAAPPFIAFVVVFIVAITVTVTLWLVGPPQ